MIFDKNFPNDSNPSSVVRIADQCKLWAQKAKMHRIMA